MWTGALNFGITLHKFVCNNSGCVKRTQPQADQARNPVQFFEKVNQPGSFRIIALPLAGIRIEVCSGQYQLTIFCLYQLLCFTQNRLRLPAARRTACQRSGTIRTAVVTAILYFQICACLLGICCTGQFFILFPQIIAIVRCKALLAQRHSIRVLSFYQFAHNRSQQFRAANCADGKVREWSQIIKLRMTATADNECFRILLAETPQHLPAFTACFGRYRTGIQDINIRRIISGH